MFNMITECKKTKIKVALIRSLAKVIIASLSGLRVQQLS